MYIEKGCYCCSEVCQWLIFISKNILTNNFAILSRNVDICESNWRQLIFIIKARTNKRKILAAVQRFENEMSLLKSEVPISIKTHRLFLIQLARLVYQDKMMNLLEQDLLLHSSVLDGLIFDNQRKFVDFIDICIDPSEADGVIALFIQGIQNFNPAK